MSISLATRGMICPCAKRTIPPETFSPILRFDVDLVLDKPRGLFVEYEQEIDRPMGLMVENVTTVVSTPRGFMVSGDSLAAPAGFDVEDLDYVSAPAGLAVEDV